MTPSCRSTWTRGRSVLVQGDRETVLRPGEVTLVDTSRPYGMAAGYPARSATPRPQLVTLMVPHAMLPGSLNTVCGGTNPSSAVHTPTTELTAAPLAQVARSVARGEKATAARPGWSSTCS